MLVHAEDEEGGVRTLTLARPPANAFDTTLLEALREAAGAAARDDRVRAVIVRGNDRFFSAGLDLMQMAGGEAAKMARFGYDDGVFALWTLPKPTIAEIGGHAIAGGAILALACDHRVASRGSQKIGLNETAIGLALPRGAFEISRAALPVERLGQWLLGAELVGPERALELGFLHELTDPGALHARCLEVARLYAQYPAGAYAYNKRLIQTPYVERCAHESDADRDALVAAWSSDETREAFLRRIATVRK